MAVAKERAMPRKNGSTLAAKDRQKLDRLIGTALLDDDVYCRLVCERDKAIFEEYQLSSRAQALLGAIHVSSLTELASYVMSLDENERLAQGGTTLRLVGHE